MKTSKQFDDGGNCDADGDADCGADDGDGDVGDDGDDGDVDDGDDDGWR